MCVYVYIPFPQKLTCGGGSRECRTHTSILNYTYLVSYIIGSMLKSSNLDIAICESYQLFLGWRQIFIFATSNLDRQKCRIEEREVRDWIFGRRRHCSCICRLHRFAGRCFCPEIWVRHWRSKKFRQVYHPRPLPWKTHTQKTTT